MTDTGAVWSVAALAAALGIGAVASATADQPERFVADVTVDTTVQDQQAQVVRRMPTVRYRLTITSGPHGDITEVAFHGTEPFAGRGPLQDPGAGFRVVHEADGSYRVLDPSGREVSVPEAASSRPPSRAEIVFDRGLAARRRALEARLGSSRERVRRFERFERAADDAVHEILVDPELALPAEINTIRQGRLAQKTTFRYGSLPDGRLYRASQRDEWRLPPEGGPQRRLVTLTTYVPVEAGAR